MKFERSKKTDLGDLKKKNQGTGVLNYKRMIMPLLEINTLYVTIETFIYFSTYYRLLLLCVTFFHLSYTQKILRD